MRYALAILFILQSFVLFNTQASAKRLALIIGNDKYDAIENLGKAVNDSIAVAETLRDIGFNVTQLRNLQRRQISLALYKFTSKIKKDDEVLFYYAGHGIAVHNNNYILPTDFPDIQQGGEDLATSEAISVNRVLSSIQKRGAKINIIILDACRSNPFPQGTRRAIGGEAGLARMEPAPGTFILFSAGYRQAALDELTRNDPNPNSVFTRKLIPLLKRPGMPLTVMAKKLRTEVETLARSVKHKQFPAYYDQLRNDYYMVPHTDKAVSSNKHTITPDASLWGMIQHSNKASDYRFYLSRFPKGAFSAVAALKLSELDKVKKKKRKKRLALLKQSDGKPAAKTVTRSYNGNWTIHYSPYAERGGCNEFSDKIKIANNQIVSGAVRGTIQSNGRLYFTRLCRVDGCKYLIKGRIYGNSGKGSMVTSSGYCRGRFIMTKN